VKSPLDCHPVVEPSGVSVDETPQQVSPRRRSYEKPRVIDHGRLADIALGGSPGRGDSGATFIQQPP